ncbi:hypothetical protein FPV67DRAFT_1040719 [Lyophyllum atratum]|nr:hypothetical protein FPV67DRAFT_1040719 [Lyophyllum atratum]
MAPTLIPEDNAHDLQSVNRLPPEILATIFTDLQPRRRSRYIIPFEVTMSHVCARWRDIALDTPLLWTMIDIYSTDSLDYVSSYLKRSQSCPSHVRFDIWESDRHLDPAAAAAFMPLVDLVIQHIARWQTLLIFTSHKSTTASILLKMADLAPPLLQRLRIVDDDELISMDPIEVLSTNPRVFAGGAPSLVALHLNSLYCLPPLINVTTLYLHTSTYFSSYELNTEVLSDLTMACPSLSFLSIHGKLLGPWSGNDITMPSVRSLWFRNRDEDTLSAKFLMTVSLPNLESLWLDCPHFPVIRMLSTSHPALPSLKYLTLHHFDFYPSTNFAKVFPTIKALHLSYCNPFNIMFLKETLIEDDYGRWPNLETLVFRTTRETHGKKLARGLDEMVTERFAVNNPIQKVLVDEDIMAVLGPHAESLRGKTNLDVLHPDNFDDPCWLMSHVDTADRL